MQPETKLYAWQTPRFNSVYFTCFLGAHKTPFSIDALWLRGAPDGACLSPVTCPLFLPTMTSAFPRTAVPRLGQLAIGADAGLGKTAPEEAGVGIRHGRVLLRPDELALPVKRGTQSRSIRIETR